MIKKELQIYELTLLLKFTTVEKMTRERLDFYINFIKEKGSQVMIKNNGKTSLAYPIKGYDIGTSVQIVYLGNDTLFRQINTEIKRDEFVLRSLTTTLKGSQLSTLKF
jgi:ribosomal protein S6